MPTVDPLAAHRFGRRDFLTLGIGAFVVASIPVSARRTAAVARRTVPVMGTVADLVVVHADPSRAQAAIDAAIEELRRVDGTMTRFSAVSDVGRVNRLAASQPVPVSTTTAAVIGEALAWARASEGAFDPCLGRASRLWDIGHRRIPPVATAVTRLAGRNFYRAIEVLASKGGASVRLTDGDAELDLGGIAKGYGVDRAVDALRGLAIRHAIVNVGGDLYALGESERGAPWRVGIRAPDESLGIVGELSVSDGAVATSGDYLQYFVHAGRRYHHLLDPRTGAPRATTMHSVTVRASTCLTADAAATAVYGMAPDRAARLLRSRAPDARIVSVLGDTT